MTDKIEEDDLTLVSKITADDDSTSRKKVSLIAHPIICYQNRKLCKQYCYNHKYTFICSLTEYAYPANQKATDYCEWGNASYVWMLNDLTSINRLSSYKGKNNASLRTFFQRIANSSWFKERWKDWRLGNRIHVPLSIQRLSDNASKIFYGLCNRDSFEIISQRWNLSLDEVIATSDEIAVILTREKKWRALDQTSEVSLTDYGLETDISEENREHQGYVPDFDVESGLLQDKHLIQKAWKKLDHVEQFVLERMDIEGDSAKSVVESLIAFNISIKEGVKPINTKIQQLFYYRDKTRAKLVELFDDEKNNDGFFK